MAAYSGTTGFDGSASAGLAQTVNAVAPTTTTLVSSMNPSMPGQEVTLTATVSPAPPEGQPVFFLDTGRKGGTINIPGCGAGLPLVKGVATCTSAGGGCVSTDPERCWSRYPGERVPWFPPW